jgi:putative membrane protein
MATDTVTISGRRPRLLAVLGLLVLAALLWSGVAPYDRGTWLMEVAPVLMAAPVLLATWRRYPLTTLLYALIALHTLVLILGGAYTYARAPLGFWLQDALDLGRNPYDKIGHFMQGLVPAMAAREVLLQRGYLRHQGMAAFLAVCTAMAISAVYELVEWASALALGQGADEFLGTQGDPWDTQSDMFYALIGATVAVTLLRRWQDRQMEALHASQQAAQMPRR